MSLTYTLDNDEEKSEPQPEPQPKPSSAPLTFKMDDAGAPKPLTFKMDDEPGLLSRAASAVKGIFTSPGAAEQPDLSDLSPPTQPARPVLTKAQQAEALRQRQADRTSARVPGSSARAQHRSHQSTGRT